MVNGLGPMDIFTATSGCSMFEELQISFIDCQVPSTSIAVFSKFVAFECELDFSGFQKRATFYIVQRYTLVFLSNFDSASCLQSMEFEICKFRLRIYRVKLERLGVNFPSVMSPTEKARATDVMLLASTLRLCTI